MQHSGMGRGGVGGELIYYLQMLSYRALANDPKNHSFTSLIAVLKNISFFSNVVGSLLAATSSMLCLFFDQIKITVQRVSCQYILILKNCHCKYLCPFLSVFVCERVLIMSNSLNGKRQHRQNKKTDSATIFPQLNALAPLPHDKSL
jgi:hypothetical protein